MLARPFRAGLLAVAPVLTLAMAGCHDAQSMPNDVALRQFENCGQLRDYAEDSILEQLIQSRYGYWYAYEGAPEAGADDGADAGGSTSESPSDYTGTNNQEEGVDEVDIVKTDGNFIYTTEGEELHIVKSWPIAETSLVSSVDLGGYPYGLFLHDDTVIAFSYFYDDQGFTDRYWGGTRVSFIDVSDRANPQVTRKIDFEGWMADGRLIDSDAYLVLNTWLPIPQAAYDLLWNDQIPLPEMDWSATPEAQEQTRNEARAILRPLVADIVSHIDTDELLPLYRDQETGAGTADTQALLSCSDVYRPADVSHYSMMSVVHLDLDDGHLGATGLLSDGWTMYASKQNLYVAQSSYWWWWGWGDNDDLSTNIHKFDLTGGDPKYVAAGKVDGWLLDQFSMSESDGKLRVASTDTDWWWGTGAEDDSGSEVSVLEDDGHGELATIGQVTGIAPGEFITGVRMLGDVGYVVTYRWVDPLWTVDLSDAHEPKLRGELTMPGFSTYLHPLDDTHIISVGYAGTETGGISGFAVNVFDVSDLDHPALTHTYQLDSDDWSWSEALWDHHAFTYHRDVLSVPVYTYDYDDQTGYWQGFSGLLVLKVTADGIEELGRVDHSDLVDDSLCYYTYYGEGDTTTEPATDCYWYAWMRRSVYVEDNVFSLSNYGIKVNDLNHPETELAKVIYHPVVTP